jgi:G3E family GTPase
MAEHTISPAPTPLTILTGFLGAGKTSLLNYILRSDHGLRVAVLVNDFGAINVDAQLVVGVQDDTISLTNGCICCSIRGDLLAAVLKLLQRPDPPEYMLIECSGIADPVAVAQTFLLPQLRRRIQLESIITVVDAEHVHERDEYQDLITDQIAAADIVLLNKIDLASPNLRAGLREWIYTLVPQARIIETTYGEAPLELVLGVGHYQLTTDHQSPVAAHRLLATDHQPLRDDRQSLRFETWSYESDKPFVFQRLRHALEHLPTDVFRAKGVLWVAEAGGRRVVAQLVGRRVSLSPAEPWGRELPRSQLVFIGSPGAVDVSNLRATLDACLVEEKSSQD